jgi:hypothetical protein
MTAINAIIIDHPGPLGLGKWIVWSWNEVQWPDGGREIRYLTSKYRLGKFEWSTDWANAATFPDYESAADFLSGLTRPSFTMVTTVQELLEIVNYPPSRVLKERIKP